MILIPLDYVVSCDDIFVLVKTSSIWSWWRVEWVTSPTRAHVYFNSVTKFLFFEDSKTKKKKTLIILCPYLIFHLRKLFKLCIIYIYLPRSRPFYILFITSAKLKLYKFYCSYDYCSWYDCLHDIMLIEILLYIFWGIL